MTYLNPYRNDKARLYFLIYSEDVHPDRITELVGIQPTQIDIKGEPKRLIKGRFYEEHRWTYSFNAEIKDATLDADFERLYNLFLPKADTLRELSNSCYIHLSIAMHIDVTEKCTGPGVIFENHLINFLSQVNASVDLDLYCMDLSSDDSEHIGE